MKFNINARMRVMLTKQGAAVYNAYLFRAGFSEHMHQAQEKMSGDVMATELWNLMHIFGPHCFIGSPIQPFHENAIEFVTGVEGV